VAYILTDLQRDCDTPLDGRPSVDSTSSTSHRSIARYRPTIVLIALGSRSVHSMRLSQILAENPISAYPTYIRRPVRGGYCHNIAMPFGTEKLEWCGYQKVKKIKDTFIRFDRMYERDRHTDRQTHRRMDGHLMTT